MYFALVFRQQGKRERNASGDTSVSSTPGNKQKMKRMESAPPALMKQKQNVPSAETTVFFMPSVDVKVRGVGGDSSYDRDVVADTMGCVGWSV